MKISIFLFILKKVARVSLISLNQFGKIKATTPAICRKVMARRFHSLTSKDFIYGRILGINLFPKK